MSEAAKLAAGWTSRKAHFEPDDLKGSGLPQHVQDAIVDVCAVSKDLSERKALSLALHAEHPEHELATAPEDADRFFTFAYRYEEVGGEIVEIRTESAEAPVTITHLPGVRPASAVDPGAALQARLQDRSGYGIESPETEG